MSDLYHVIYSSKAMEDLKDIYAYIADELQVPDTAEKQVNRIRQAVRKLNFMPSRHALVDWEPWESMEMHKMPIDHFVVFYLVNSQTMMVSVIRIVYGKRDIKRIAESDSET